MARSAAATCPRSVAEPRRSLYCKGSMPRRMLVFWASLGGGDARRPRQRAARLRLAPRDRQRDTEGRRVHRRARRRQLADSRDRRLRRRSLAGGRRRRRRRRNGGRSRMHAGPELVQHALRDRAGQLRPDARCSSDGGGCPQGESCVSNVCACSPIPHGAPAAAARRPTTAATRSIAAAPATAAPVATATSAAACRIRWRRPARESSAGRRPTTAA